MAAERERQTRQPDEGQKRESGMPGGGKGRIDKTGKSGVYPASGPMPPGDAEVQGMASWGQGDRGAEGYHDHGGSELTNVGDEKALGGLTAGPSGGPEGERGRESELPPEMRKREGKKRKSA